MQRLLRKSLDSLLHLGADVLNLLGESVHIRGKPRSKQNLRVFTTLMSAGFALG